MSGPTVPESSLRPPPPAAPVRAFLALFGAQLRVALLFYLLGLWGFVGFSRGQDDAFTALATGPHLGTVVASQVRVLPAYLLVALAYTALTFPWATARRALSHRALRGFATLLGLDAAVYLLSLGVFFHTNPGLLDGTARKVAPFAPGLDLYVLYRWHLLDAAAIGFTLVCAAALIFYVRGWWRAARRASPAGRLGHATGAVALGLLTLGWSRAAAPPTPPPRTADTPPNVLIIASDSLRFDRLGVHGHHRRDISPNIDAFAAEAIDLTRLHVATASTLESWMTFMSGQFPPTHGVRYMYLRREQAEAIAHREELLPRLLNRAGYHTIVSSNWAGNCFKLIDVGFTQNMASDVQNFDALVMEGAVWSHLIFPLYFSNALGEWMLPEIRRISGYLRPNVLTDRMFGAVDEATARGQPFFGLLFFSTTHLPYTASHPYNLKYTDPMYDGPHRYQIDVRVHELITTGFAPTLPPLVIDHIRDLYDGTVSEFDAYVGEALAALEARGLADRTIVIVTTDHGEDLYDPGSTLGHGTNFFGGDQSTHIPFFLRVPPADTPPGWPSAGARIDALARNVDLAPTLLELLGRAVPPTMEGQSLVPLLTGARTDLDLPIFAETCYLFFPKSKAMGMLTAEERARLFEVPGAVETLDVDPAFDNNLVLRPDLHEPVLRAKDRMVRTRRWKLIEMPGTPTPVLRLYDMVADPGQTTDVASLHPALVERLRHALHTYDAGAGGAVRWPAAAEMPEAPPTP
jgi:arylsulfatase A-like enzyme